MEGCEGRGGRKEEQGVSEGTNRLVLKDFSPRIREAGPIHWSRPTLYIIIEEEIT